MHPTNSATATISLHLYVQANRGSTAEFNCQMFIMNKFPEAQHSAPISNQKGQGHRTAHGRFFTV